MVDGFVEKSDNAAFEQKAKERFCEWTKSRFFMAPDIDEQCFIMATHEVSYLLDLDSLVEKRYEIEVKEGHEGGVVQGERYRDLWDIPATVPNDYSERSQSYIKEGCDEVIKCSSCGGQGYFVCTVCAGKGRVTVPYVDSKGKQRQRSVTCSNCRGSGRLTCSSCDGKGSIATYVKGNIEWRPISRKWFAAKPPIPEGLLARIEPDEQVAHEGFVVAKVAELPDEIRDIIGQEYKVREDLADNERLRRSTLKVGSYFLNHVDYTTKDHGDKKYSVYFYGQQKTYAHSYPKNLKQIGWMSLVAAEALLLLSVIGGYLMKM